MESTDKKNQVVEKTGYYVTDEERAEWAALEGEEAERGFSYRKRCKKQDIHPTPPSQWIKCPVCGYRTPGSLVSHYNSAKDGHGGVNGVAKFMGCMPEEVPLVTDDMMKRFQEAGAQANKKNKKDDAAPTGDEKPAVTAA